MNDLAARLRFRRRALNLTLVQASRAARISPSTLSVFERGFSTIAKLPLRRLEKFLAKAERSARSSHVHEADRQSV